ncbi:MAG: flagellar basal body-associated FliL family protein [Candidatus Magnetoovum sp. WYHC-5]|nr:flagellar basal body-associated FliL family protein [Candidatus Magnetoovum sp. WYHC-5]
MAEETDSYEEQTEQKGQGKGAGMKKILVVVGLIVVLGGGGFFGYKQFMAPKNGAGDTKTETPAKGEKAATKEDGHTKLLVLGSFIVNLTDNGRFMKVGMDIEVDEANEKLIEKKMSVLKDAIIILLSGKTYDSITRPEGKVQLKDEVLMSLNQALDADDIVKNLYFTEFVVQ